MNNNESAPRIALLCLLLFAAPAFSETFELNGLELGKTATRELIKSTIGLSCSAQCDSGRGCYVSCGTGKTLIAGVKASTLVGLDAGHTVQCISASFDTASFEIISSAFTAKYGAPTRVDYSVITTADGKQFDQMLNIWRNEAGDEIRIFRYIRDDIGLGSLTLKIKSQIYQPPAS